MNRDRLIKFRATVNEEKRVDELAKKSGNTVSGFLRQLIVNAELQPTNALQPTANLTNSDASALVLPDRAGIAL